MTNLRFLFMVCNALSPSSVKELFCRRVEHSVLPHFALLLIRPQRTARSACFSDGKTARAWRKIFQSKRWLLLCEKWRA